MPPQVHGDKERRRRGVEQPTCYITWGGCHPPIPPPIPLHKTEQEGESYHAVPATGPCPALRHCALPTPHHPNNPPPRAHLHAAQRRARPCDEVGCQAAGVRGHGAHDGLARRHQRRCQLAPRVLQRASGGREGRQKGLALTAAGGGGTQNLRKGVCGRVHTWWGGDGERGAAEGCGQESEGGSEL